MKFFDLAKTLLPAPPVEVERIKTDRPFSCPCCGQTVVPAAGAADKPKPADGPKADAEKTSLTQIDDTEPASRAGFSRRDEDHCCHYCGRPAIRKAYGFWWCPDHIQEALDYDEGGEYR